MMDRLLLILTLILPLAALAQAPDSSAAAAALHQADRLFHMGWFAPAERLARSAQAGFAAALGPDHPRVAEAWERAGHAALNLERSGEACEYMAQALQTRIRSGRLVKSEFIGLANNLFSAYIMRGSLDHQILPTVNRLIELVSAHEPNPVNQLLTRMLRINVCEKQDKHDLVISECLQVYGKLRQVYPDRTHLLEHEKALVAFLVIDLFNPFNRQQTIQRLMNYVSSAEESAFSRMTCLSVILHMALLHDDKQIIQLFSNEFFTIMQQVPDASYWSQSTLIRSTQVLSRLLTLDLQIENQAPTWRDSMRAVVAAEFESLYRDQIWNDAARLPNRYTSASNLEILAQKMADLAYREGNLEASVTFSDLIASYGSRLVAFKRSLAVRCPDWHATETKLLALMQEEFAQWQRFDSLLHVWSLDPAAGLPDFAPWLAWCEAEIDLRSRERVFTEQLAAWRDTDALESLLAPPDWTAMQAALPHTVIVCLQLPHLPNNPARAIWFDAESSGSVPLQVAYPTVGTKLDPHLSRLSSSRVRKFNASFHPQAGESTSQATDLEAYLKEGQQLDALIFQPFDSIVNGRPVIWVFHSKIKPLNFNLFLAALPPDAITSWPQVKAQQPELFWEASGHGSKLFQASRANRKLPVLAQSLWGLCRLNQKTADRVSVFNPVANASFEIETLANQSFRKLPDALALQSLRANLRSYGLHDLGLQQAVVEAQAVERLAQNQGLYFMELREEAHLPRILSELPKPHLIQHWITHGWHDGQTLDGVYLLCQAAPDSQTTCFLGEHQIHSQTLQTRLVVLSSCESGVGFQQAGFGSRGLAQAFLRAGAHMVIASRWKVDDASTAALMSYFYEALNRDFDRKLPVARVAAALQEAMQRLAATETFAHPAHWAGWQLLLP